MALGIGLINCLLFLFANKPNGTFGFTATLVSSRPAVTVHHVEQPGPAYAAGVRAGDVLTYADGVRDTTVMILLTSTAIVEPGDRIRVRVQRHRTTLADPITLVAVADAGSISYEAIYFSALAIPLLLLGWLTVWLRPKSVDAVTLGAVLLALGLWNSFPDRVGTPEVRFLFNSIFSSFCYLVGKFAIAAFFARFPDGEGTRRSRLRKIMLRISVMFALLGTTVMLLSYLLPLYVGLDRRFPFVSLPIVTLLPIATIISFIDAYRSGSAPERMRLRWIGGSYFAGFCGPELIPAAAILLGAGFTVLDQVLLESTLFIFALGIAYAILGRRVVDVRVAISRALVFSTISGIVVALFIAAEWVAGLVFLHLSRATSVLIEVGIAVAIGFSLRPLHLRVDRAIDSIFFAKRHAAERALHHLATEVSFIRNRETLLARVQRDLIRYLEVRDASIYARDDARSDFALLTSSDDAPEFIDADDDAAVALAVSEGPVYLHARSTLITGELAIPLIVRKVLIGFIALGPKYGGEAFASDELASLRFLSGYLSPALLSANEVQAGLANESLLRELLVELRALNARLTPPP